MCNTIQYNTAPIYALLSGMHIVTWLNFYFYCCALILKCIRLLRVRAVGIKHYLNTIWSKPSNTIK